MHPAAEPITAITANRTANCILRPSAVNPVALNMPISVRSRMNMRLHIILTMTAANMSSTAYIEYERLFITTLTTDLYILTVPLSLKSSAVRVSYSDVTISITCCCFDTSDSFMKALLISLSPALSMPSGVMSPAMPNSITVWKYPVITYSSSLSLQHTVMVSPVFLPISSDTNFVIMISLSYFGTLPSRGSMVSSAERYDFTLIYSSSRVI